MVTRYLPETMATDDNIAVAKIDYDGDVILELSDDQVVKIHLLIPSNILIWYLLSWEICLSASFEHDSPPIQAAAHNSFPRG